MSDDTETRTKNGKGLKGLVIKIASAIILLVTGWMFNSILTLISDTSELRSIMATKKDIGQLKAAVQELKNTNAQWATMAETKEDVIQLRIKQGVHDALIKVLLRAYEVDLSDLIDFEDRAAGEESDRPRIKIPKFEKPEIDPDRFRQQQQQRYEKGK